MIKALLSGAVASALLTSSAAAAVRADSPVWIIVPEQQVCRTELELMGASGAAIAAALVSDGDSVDLVLPKPGAPEQAFLPIRVDQKPFPNLVLRRPDGRTAAMQLSPETLTALRKGGVMQIGWLGDEPVQTGLVGSDQGLTDLRTCGAQVAARFRARQAAEREARSRTEAEARARELAEEQLAAVKAQREAAEAEIARANAEAERLRAQAEADAREREQRQAQGYTYPRGYPVPQGYYPRAPYERYAPPAPYRHW